jgi:hypothetical protein
MRYLLSIIALFALLISASASPLTTTPYLQGLTLSTCGANYPILGNGSGNTPICGSGALGAAAYSVATVTLGSTTMTLGSTYGTIAGAINLSGTLSFGVLSPTSLGASPTTITGLTNDSSIVGNNDYLIVYSAAAGAIQKATISSVVSSGVAGVSSLNGLTGSLSIIAGTDIAVSAAGFGVTVNFAIPGSSSGITTFASANASATNYTLTAPAASGTLSLLGLAETFTALKTFNNSDLCILGSSTGCTTFTSANASATAYTITLPAASGTLNLYNSATLQASPSNPTGTTNTTGVMMGLGGTCKLTPTYSTRVQIWFIGDIGSSAAADGGVFTAYYGTSTAPGNGVSVTGTAVNGPISSIAQSANANPRIPFTSGGIITGLTPGTAYWFDLYLAANGGGTATALNLNCTAFEF